MHSGVLVQQHRDVGGGRFPAQTLQGGEAHHHGGHLVFVHQHDLLGKLRVVADAAVAAEEVIQQLCHVVDDQVLLGVADAQILAPETLGVPVHHHGNGQVVCHPAVAQHGLDVPGDHDEFRQDQHDAEPAGVIVKGIHQAAPLAALADDGAVLVQIAVMDVAADLIHGWHLPESS